MLEESYESKSQEYYHFARNEVLQFCRGALADRPMSRVLEVGCGGGDFGENFKAEFKVSTYVGVELMEEYAQDARKRLDHVFIGEIQALVTDENLTELAGDGFDAIIFLDVLEHLLDPWETLHQIKALLAPKGIVIASIPNAGNMYVVKRLLTDRFEYEQSGLLDITHLRFFTRHTIVKMFADCDYEMKAVDRVISDPGPKGRLLQILTLNRLKALYTLQYLVVAERR